MGRLRRFEGHRYVGVRSGMRFYDCDDPDQFATLERRLEAEDLLERTLLQAFAPDSAEEARNRGFRPAGGTGSP